MKKIGIALGSGSAYGFTHIGILKVLEKNNIKIDYIAGTSIGALIGAVYASGISALQLEDLAKETNIASLLDFTIPKSGLLFGKKIEKLIEKLTYNKEFKELAIPLSIIAADIKNGEKVVFNSGSVARAVRASISIPALFTPIKQDKKVLIDGGIVDPVPVDIVKEMGADIIIAVDLTIDIKYKKDRAIFPRESNFIKEMQKNFIDAMFSNFDKFLMTKGKIKFIVKLIYKIIKPERIKNYIRKLLSNHYATPEILKIIMETESLMMNELARNQLKNAKVDILISPNIKNISSFEFDKIDYLIKKGEESAEKIIPKLKRMLNN